MTIQLSPKRKELPKKAVTPKPATSAPKVEEAQQDEE